MQPPSSSSSTIPYTRQHFIRDVLELAKQRMLSRHAKNATATATSSSSSSSYSIQGEMNANARANDANVEFMDMIVGVFYILVVMSFLVKILLKMLDRFESHFMSSHDGVYNRFAFIANEDFEQETGDEEYEEEDNVESSLSSSSPILLRSTLSITPVTHVPNIITPMNKINIVTPKTPSAPRRSLRLKIKSELNLTSMKTLNKTNAVTRSQTRESRGSHFTNEKNFVSSDPLPLSLPPASSLFYRNQNNNSVATPSPHPENDEELAYIVQRCYERTLKKRSRFNSPLLVRRLVL